MSSAGRNLNSNDENRRKIIYQNMEHLRKKETNKENVCPCVRTSTGAIKRSTLQIPKRHSCESIKSTRQPLSNVQVTNLHVRDDFKKADFISGNLKLGKSNVPIIPKSRLSSTIKEPNFTPSNNKFETGTSRSSCVRKPSEIIVDDHTVEDSAFWLSFVETSKVDRPYMKARKFPVPNANAIYKKTILQKTYTVVNVHDSIPSLKKKTLKKQLSQHSGYLGIVSLDPNAPKVDPKLLYSYEYMNDIIYNTFVRQGSYIIKSELLNRNISVAENRALIINWLVKLHQYFHSNIDIFYMTVRLFDKILTLIDLPVFKYQLVGIACYWIMEKYMNSATHITGQKLVKLCNDAFSLKNLLETEKTILVILKFNFSVGDPVVFVYYFIYIMQLYESNLIGFCANYLLEILSLDLNCNSYPLSLQGAAAVYLSLKFFNIEDEVWEKLNNYYAYHDSSEMFELHKIMIKNLILVSDDNCPYKESFIKYSSEKYGKISSLISKYFIKCYSAQDITLLAS